VPCELLRQTHLTIPTHHFILRPLQIQQTSSPPTVRIKLNNITSSQQTSDRWCIWIAFLKCTVPVCPTPFLNYFVSPKNVNERYKSQAEHSFPASRRRSFLRRRRRNGRWPHPALLPHFVFISLRTEFFLEKYSYYSCRLNKAVNWETELHSHVARNGHCISTRMVQSLWREKGWTRRPVSEHTVTTYWESEKQFVVCHRNISKTF
jgi:hypothetical protein